MEELIAIYKKEEPLESENLLSDGSFYPIC